MIKIIGDYVNSRVNEGETNYAIADTLGVSVGMVSSYKAYDYNPSLAVALRLYEAEGVVLHPFAEESLKHELNRGNKR